MFYLFTDFLLTELLTESVDLLQPCGGRAATTAQGQGSLQQGFRHDKQRWVKAPKSWVYLHTHTSYVYLHTHIHTHTYKYIHSHARTHTYIHTYRYEPQSGYAGRVVGSGSEAVITLETPLGTTSSLPPHPLHPWWEHHRAPDSDIVTDVVVASAPPPPPPAVPSNVTAAVGERDREIEREREREREIEREREREREIIRYGTPTVILRPFVQTFLWDEILRMY